MSRRPNPDVMRAAARSLPPKPNLHLSDHNHTLSFDSLNRVGDGVYMPAGPVQPKPAPVRSINEPGRGEDHARVQRAR